jgi:hypothetical protein
MAKVVTFMNTTGKSLVALQEAHMKPSRVSSFSCRAANFFALVTFAFLAHVAYLDAKELLGLFELLGRHQILLELLGVVDCEAAHISRVSAASAWLLGHTLASFARTSMAGLLALVETARKIPVASVLAIRYRVGASLPLSSDERLNRVVSTRTVL